MAPKSSSFSGVARQIGATRLANIARAFMMNGASTVWLSQDRMRRRTMQFMAERAADKVTVPDVVGLPFHVGRDIADDAGVTLANPDPDGPPIGALAWPGLFYITSQQPTAGTKVHRWDSVAVEITEHGTAESNATRHDDQPPLKDDEHATPEPERFMNLTDRDGAA